MNLRDHPLLDRSWPPVWVNTQCAPAEKINGEIGTLIRVIFYPEIPRKLFLIMELEQERYHKRYMGCLFCGDAGFHSTWPTHK
jgi:hypothetical protein